MKNSVFVVSKLHTNKIVGIFQDKKEAERFVQRNEIEFSSLTIDEETIYNKSEQCEKEWGFDNENNR